MSERGIARDGQDVYIEGVKVGHVTSGSPAPYLKKNIGMAYLHIEHVGLGTKIKIDVRGRMVGAEVVPTPFYKREKK